MFIDRNDIAPFETKVCLAAPFMHGEELAYIRDAFDKNWITTAGDNVEETERRLREYVGCGHGVGLSSGTAALHLSVKAAALRLDPGIKPTDGFLRGKRVFCSDVTFGATVNPVVYEGGQPVFIDSEYESWNMDPGAFEKAFMDYPDVKLVLAVNLYGTPAKLDEISKICSQHGALLIEDAAESLGASYKGKQTGSFGQYGVVSFNGNKIITGSCGGMVLTDDGKDADKIRKWSTQAREAAPWYQHEELGYDYRLSNVAAGIVRGQMEHLEEHVAKKKAIYERYKRGLAGFPVDMNPYDGRDCIPNFWLSCLLIRRDAMCRQVRSEKEVLYMPEHGKSCPTEILEKLAEHHAEGRPIWKPMHLQPIYQANGFVTAEGKDRMYGSGVGTDLFQRGLCLPSDINMREKEQLKIIEIIKRCFE